MEQLSDINKLLDSLDGDTLAQPLLAFIWGDHVRLEQWQLEPLEEICNFLLSDEPRQELFMCISGAHGTGKTTLMVWAILLSLLLLTIQGDDFKGSLYSGKFDQLKTTLFREALVWATKSRFKDAFDLRAHKLGIQGSYCAIDAKSWSETDVQKSAGQHANTSLMFIDEATAVPKEVIDKLHGSTTDKRVLWLMTCNPDKNYGFVYDLFEKHNFQWKTIKVAHSDLTFLRSENFEERIRTQYGEDSDQYRVQVLGDFPKYMSETFIDRDFLNAARERTPIKTSAATIKMAVDVASGLGADYSTIVVRKGATILYAWRERVLLEELKIKIITVANRFNISNPAIDEIGIGLGFTPFLRDQFPGLIGVNGSSAPNNRVRFYNRRAELYSELRDWIMGYGRIPSNELFDILIEELVSIEYEYHGTQLKIVSKKQLKKSPDFADALAYTFAVPERLDNRLQSAAQSNVTVASCGKRSQRTTFYQGYA